MELTNIGLAKIVYFGISVTGTCHFIIDSFHDGLTWEKSFVNEKSGISQMIIGAFSKTTQLVRFGGAMAKNKFSDVPIFSQKFLKMGS